MSNSILNTILHSMKYILNISIYLSLHAMISMWSVFYTYTVISTLHKKVIEFFYNDETPVNLFFVP